MICLQFNMETWCVVLVTLIISTTFICLSTESTSISIQNSCPHTIWPAAVTIVTGSPPSNTGFALDPGAWNTIDVPSDWKGRLWARTFCGTNSSGGGFTCAIGDCGSGQVSCNGSGSTPPVTILEFYLNTDMDSYVISLVYGFNLPVTIEPQTPGCPSTSCPRDLNAVCPSRLAIWASDGGVIGCQNACLVFDNYDDCCTPSLGSEESSCPGTSYSRFFKSQCSQASIANGAGSNPFQCPGGGDYVITFCPTNSTKSDFLGMFCVP